jgi:hypothetical protein
MSLPAFRFRSLQARIVVVFLVLLLTVQVAGYALIENAITGNARRHAQNELAVGARMFQRLLAQSAQRLTQAGQALAGDFALREAVATRDQAAIAAILRRQPDRASADLALLVAPSGQLLGDAAFPPQAGPVRSRIRSPAPRAGSASPASRSSAAMPINWSRCRCGRPRRWAGSSSGCAWMTGS